VLLLLVVVSLLVAAVEPAAADVRKNFVPELCKHLVCHQNLGGRDALRSRDLCCQLADIRTNLAAFILYRINTQMNSSETKSESGQTHLRPLNCDIDESTSGTQSIGSVFDDNEVPPVTIISMVGPVSVDAEDDESVPDSEPASEPQSVEELSKLPSDAASVAPSASLHHSSTSSSSHEEAGDDTVHTVSSSVETTSTQAQSHQTIHDDDRLKVTLTFDNTSTDENADEATSHNEDIIVAPASPTKTKKVTVVSTKPTPKPAVKTPVKAKKAAVNITTKAPVKKNLKCPKESKSDECSKDCSRDGSHSIAWYIVAFIIFVIFIIVVVFLCVYYGAGNYSATPAAASCATSCAPTATNCGNGGCVNSASSAGVC
jgi:hypothetical protein